MKRQLTTTQTAEMTAKYGEVAVQAYNLIANELEKNHDKHREQTQSEMQAQCDEIAERLLNR